MCEQRTLALVNPSRPVSWHQYLVWKLETVHVPLLSGIISTTSRIPMDLVLKAGKFWGVAVPVKTVFATLTSLPFGCVLYSAPLATALDQVGDIKSRV